MLKVNDSRLSAEIPQTFKLTSIINWLYIIKLNGIEPGYNYSIFMRVLFCCPFNLVCFLTVLKQFIYDFSSVCAKVWVKPLSWALEFVYLLGLIIVHLLMTDWPFWPITSSVSSEYPASHPMINEYQQQYTLLPPNQHMKDGIDNGWCSDCFAIKLSNSATYECSSIVVKSVCACVHQKI